MCSCDCVLYWLSVLCQTFCLEEVHRQFDQQDQGQPPPPYSEIDRGSTSVMMTSSETWKTQGENPGGNHKLDTDCKFIFYLYTLCNKIIKFILYSVSICSLRHLGWSEMGL